jgi:ParB family chromosome partitioning protein
VCSGHADPAADLWAEVRRRGRPDLLAAAVRAHRAGLRPAAEAVDAAEAGRDVANAARSAALRRPTPAADAVTDRTDNHRPADGNAATDDGNTAADTAELVDATVVGATLTHLRGILTALREGRQLSRFDAGSLRLLTTQIQQHLATPAPHPAPTPEPATREGRAAA